MYIFFWPYIDERMYFKKVIPYIIIQEKEKNTYKQKKKFDSTVKREPSPNLTQYTGSCLNTGAGVLDWKPA